MVAVVFSSSSSFQHFLGEQLDIPIEFRGQLGALGDDPRQVHLLHISSFANHTSRWLKRNVRGQSVNVAICSDVPNVQEMLECVHLGARGYCNSHMAPPHYLQLLDMLANGQSWFPPGLLDETFKLAQQAAEASAQQNPISALTARENEIARCVAEGMSNRYIADFLGISEPTVKTHLTRIFRKLELKDRVGLVLHLKGS
jgi:DNA-binding NarL/FixJ family response regulator